MRLFHRTTRALRLTEDGAGFLPYAEAALDNLEQGVACAGGRTVQPRGSLRMTAPASFGRMHILPALADFHAHYPAVALDLRFADEVVDLVGGGFDLAVRNAELTDSALIARKLAPDRRQLVAAPSYLASVGAPAQPADLRGHRTLAVGGHDRWAFADGRVVAVDPWLRLNDGEGVRLAAEAGLGISLQATWSAGEALAAGRLVPVLADHPLAGDHAIWALYPSAALMPPKLRVMLDFLAARFAAPPYWERGATDPA